MNDNEVRAELERIGFAELWDQASDIKATLYAKNGSTMSFHHSIAKALRLLAESQQALREIEQKTKKLITHPPIPGHTLPIMLANALVVVNKIAKNACKGGYEGPRLEPIPPTSLKCKCGYVLKPQDGSCPMCKKLFGKEV